MTGREDNSNLSMQVRDNTNGPVRVAILMLVLIKRLTRVPETPRFN